jgi:uncharacterized membrane protein YfcA
MKNNTTTMVLSSVGALAGLYFAFKKNKKFWGYAGYFVLGSIAGHLAGNVVTAVIPQPKADKTTTTTVKSDGAETTTTTTNQ